VLQLELEALLKEKELALESREANAEIFLVIFWLSQIGQETSPILLLLNTSCSKGIPQSSHTNSKRGIFYSNNLIS
jgi:hypothetical protein